MPWTVVWYCYMIHIKSIFQGNLYYGVFTYQKHQLNSNQCCDLKMKFSFCMESVRACVFLKRNEIFVLAN